MATRTHTHPMPEKWAQLLSIAGIDRGVFSTVKAQGSAFIVSFDNGIVVKVVKGKLQSSYTL